MVMPCQYVVLLDEGAIVRRSPELSSAPLFELSKGETVTVTRRCFSEHPAQSCIPRFGLSAGSGWLSGRLNRPHPMNLLVIELASVSTVDMGEFHISELLNANTKNRDMTRGSQLPSTCPLAANAPLEPSAGSLARAPPQSVSRTSNNNRGEETCLICLSESRTATLVHGETGHVACCLQCARILRARGDPCPVCRIPIDLVVQHFYA